MTVLWLRALVLAGCSLVACDDDDDCTRLCQKLETCGMLPSPLGTDPGNCAQRCQVSAQLRSGLIECSADLVESTWCGASPETCARLATCADTAVAEQSLRGRGTLRLLPTDVRASSSAAGDAIQCAAGRGCAPALDPGSAERLCEAWRASDATFFLLGEHSVYRSTGNCVRLLSDPPLLRHVPVEPLRAGIVLQGARIVAGDGGATGGNGAAGASTDEPSAAPSCRVFLSALTVNRAGAACVAIEVPLSEETDAGRACEGGSACSDGVDNDGDGLLDCHDPKCNTACPTQTPMSLSTEPSGGAGAL